ncbi:MAG: hypothetical protein ACLS9G_07755 [Akkermansia sp.]
MDYSVESIKKWLKSTGKDRNWLAEKLYVSKSTVDNWLAPSTPTPIPKSKAAFIHSLMEQSQTVESKKVNYDDVLTFSVRLTPEEWKALLPPHVDPKDYAAAEKYIRNLLQSIVDSTPPRPRPPEPDNNA